MKYDPLAYEMPWRENYEARASFAWIAAMIVALVVQRMSSLPAGPFYWMVGICFAMFLLRVPKAYWLYRLQRHLLGRGLEFKTLSDLEKIVSKKQDEQWIGKGFYWEQRHAQRVFEILKRDWSEITGTESKMRTLANKIRGYDLHQEMGQPWIHGVEPEEKMLFQPMKHVEGHTLIVGTTGAGKTRIFDTLISQAIMRGEAVIIVDPKGDKELRDNARRCCVKMGQPERFLAFHPGFPEESVRIDMLRNFSRVTEIASRLAALIPSEAGADPFTAFGWQALNNISQGLLIADSRPNIVTLRRFLEGGTTSLVIKSIHAYAKSVLPDIEEAFAPYRKENLPLIKQAFNYIKFYYEKVQPVKPSSELEGLINMFQHDETHFSKMVANLLPIMNMLTSGPLNSLLSPDPSDMDDDRIITNSAKVINNAEVLYMGLDSLTDNMVGAALGSLFLSDLTAVAGDRYNYGVDTRPVNVFIDEAAEVINEPFIQLLNKGRGAKIRLYVATQTFADFSSRMGSKDKALQVLGNINNTFALRIVDNETQEFIADSLPKTRLQYVMRTQGQNTDSSQPVLHGGNQGERLMEEEGELFPSQLLGMLPNLEYIAKLSGGKIIKGRLPIIVEEKKK